MGGGMAANGLKRCAFYPTFRIYNFYDPSWGGTVRKLAKIGEKKRIEADRNELKRKS